MPNSEEALTFDEMGMCPACQSSEQKMHINWVKRQQDLKTLLDNYRNLDGKNYDCIVPISGGKDSAFQLHVLTRLYKIRPLAVTFSHNWFSETGKWNLENIVDKMGIDHIMFIPNRGSIGKIARESLYQIGDSCWHCHMGIGAFPLQVAVKFGIKLLIWGESVSENTGRATYDKPIKFDRDYFVKISAKKYPDEMINSRSKISNSDLIPYQLPSYEDIERVGVVGVHLGDYIFWDEQRQTEFLIKEYGWREDKVEGTYKRYKSVECRMPGVHDYSKFLKRGFGRTTDHASHDIRNGLLTREEGFKLIEKFDFERPGALDYYLKVTGFTEEEFEKILFDKRTGAAVNLPKEELLARVKGHRLNRKPESKT